MGEWASEWVVKSMYTWNGEWTIKSNISFPFSWHIGVETECFPDYTQIACGVRSHH